MKKYKHKSKDPFLERESEKYEIPIPSREYILATLKEISKPAKIKHLLAHFDIHDPNLREGLRRRLKAMVRDGQLIKIRRQGFMVVESEEEVEGELLFIKEREVVCITEDNRRIPVQLSTIRGCFSGDTVLVKVRYVSDTQEAVARVVELLEAKELTIVGRLYKDRKIYKALPLEKNIYQHVTIPKANKGKAKPDDIVLIKLSRDPKYSTHEDLVGEVVEILGDFSTTGIEIDMAIKKFGLPCSWPKSVDKLSQKLPDKITPQSKRNRSDLVDMPFVTIDGEDARDFDDAVFCEETASGWRLSVAIADVSFYVKSNTPLDKEAKRRGNSTYFPNKVIPMLPESLSNQLCSLKPEEERLVVVCHMTVNKEGRVTRSRFERAVICSHARLTYTEVSSLYEGNKKLQKKHKDLLPNLTALKAVYSALCHQRLKRGALDLETVENRILFNEVGKIDKIIPVYRNDAHKVIEECMLAANVCAAKFILRHKRPGLFRVHDEPPAEKLLAFRKFLSELGLSLKGSKHKPEAWAYQDILNLSKSRPDGHIIQTMVLRSLSQAQYRNKNVGHFGLAYPYYVHFTSPIRRYPDLIIHRIIVGILADKQKNIYSTEDLEAIGEHCSTTERRSDDATRDATFALKCHYMQDKVGEEFDGVISGVTSFGLFVELKEIYVEGLVHVSQLGHEYFHYDPVKHLMIGEHSRQSYQLGQEVQVRVVRVDLEDKKIDFELINEKMLTKKPKKSKKRKTKSKSSRKR